MRNHFQRNGVNYMKYGTELKLESLSVVRHRKGSRREVFVNFLRLGIKSLNFILPRRLTVSWNHDGIVTPNEFKCPPLDQQLQNGARGHTIGSFAIEFNRKHEEAGLIRDA